MARLTLFSYFQSSSSWRVRIALALKQLDYEYKAIDLMQGDHFSDKYRRLNPRGLVPVLQVNDQHVTQSISIMEYLDEAYPDTYPLLPKGHPLNRALVRSLALDIASDIHPLQNLSVRKHLKDIGVNDKKFANWVITKEFRGVEKSLKKTAGKYCFGNNITMADICLLPQITNAKLRFNVNMKHFPIISSIEKELKKHDAFSSTHPENQPDYPQGWVPE